MDGSCENLKNTGRFLKKTQGKRRTQPIWFYYPHLNLFIVSEVTWNEFLRK